MKHERGREREQSQQTHQKHGEETQPGERHRWMAEGGASAVGPLGGGVKSLEVPLSSRVWMRGLQEYVPVYYP